MKILVQPPKPQSSYSGLYTRHRVEGVGFGVVFGGAWAAAQFFSKKSLVRASICPGSAVGQIFEASVADPRFRM